MTEVLRLKNAQQVNNKVKRESELQIQVFVCAFLKQIEETEKFYIEKQNELILDFIKLQIHASEKAGIFDDNPQNYSSLGMKSFVGVKKQYTHPITKEILTLDDIVDKKSSKLGLDDMYKMDESLVSFLIELSHGEAGQDIRTSAVDDLRSSRVTELLQSSQKFKDNHKINKKKRIAPKDELAIATSKSRAFQRIYDEAKWLNAFAIINYVAAQKIVKKLTKKMTQIGYEQNIISHNLEQILSMTEFKKNRFIFRFSEDIVEMYAILIEGGDKVKALRNLNKIPEISSS